MDAGVRNGLGRPALHAYVLAAVRGGATAPLHRGQSRRQVAGGPAGKARMHPDGGVQVRVCVTHHGRRSIAQPDSWSRRRP
jgi:hypothetical protein